MSVEVYTTDSVLHAVAVVLISVVDDVELVVNTVGAAKDLLHIIIKPRICVSLMAYIIYSAQFVYFMAIGINIIVRNWKLLKEGMYTCIICTYRNDHPSRETRHSEKLNLLLL